MRRHLADWELALCAAPSYLAAHGTPAQPEDLAALDFITLPPWHHGADILIGPAGRRFRIAATPRVLSNNQVSIRELTLAGIGLSFQALPEVAADVSAGRLLRVLPEWSLPTLSVDALMVSRAHQPAKVRLVLDRLKQYLGGLVQAAALARGHGPAPAKRQSRRQHQEGKR